MKTRLEVYSHNEIVHHIILNNALKSLFFLSIVLILYHKFESKYY